MLAEYKREEDEYNTAVKNLEPLKTKTQEMLAATERQNKTIETLQKIINDNNETINSLKKIKNLSIFDHLKTKEADLVDNLGINKVNDLDIVKDKIKEDDVKNLVKKQEGETKETKFDSNWNPQFPDFIRE
ncbi:hypothetical protein ACJMK2_014992 [Sinanodonta woodiana]|uniref:Uncharacterized protein n=1 Tax=Sinanodonta woodiana TaxID=1069815 RepID=A0ABD3V2L6_SINWO